MTPVSFCNTEMSSVFGSEIVGEEINTERMWKQIARGLGRD